MHFCKGAHEGRSDGVSGYDLPVRNALVRNT